MVYRCETTIDVIDILKFYAASKNVGILVEL